MTEILTSIPERETLRTRPVPQKHRADNRVRCIICDCILAHDNEELWCRPCEEAGRVTREGRPCGICGEPIPPEKIASAKYCSYGCVQKARQRSDKRRRK